MFVLFGKYKSRLLVGDELVGYITVLIVNLDQTDNNGLTLRKTFLQQNLYIVKIDPFGHLIKNEVCKIKLCS